METVFLYSGKNYQKFVVRKTTKNSDYGTICKNHVEEEQIICRLKNLPITLLSLISRHI
jgi:hypothetical protein